MWYERTNRLKFKYKTTQNISFTFDKLKYNYSVYSRKGQLLATVKNGIMTVYKGFVWDGATCAPDFHSIMRATVLHDILCQMVKCSLWEKNRKHADIWFNRVMKEDKVNIIIRLIYFNAVLKFGEIQKFLFGSKRKEKVILERFPISE